MNEKMKTLVQKLQHTIWAGSFSFALFFSPLASNALTVEEVPNPRQVSGGWVTDLADVLTDETEGKLNRMISRLEDKNGTEIAVVTVPKTSPSASTKAFATELFNYWGIGKAEEDNGILFLISLGDRRVEIETGYGIEPILPNAQVQEIIDSKITPPLKQGNFDKGTKEGTKALVVALEPSLASPLSSLPLANLLKWGFGLAVAGGAITYLRYRRRVFLTPQGKSRINDSNPVFFCSQSRKPMQKVDQETVNSHLTKAEKVAQHLGSVRFEGWKSPNPNQDLTGRGFHLVGYPQKSVYFKECPNCQELTVVHTNETIKKPTRNKTGESKMIDKCHCCDYLQERKKIIPTLPAPRYRSTSHRSSSSTSVGSYGSSCSSGGSSSGGGFGGGSSGGDGGGGGF